MQLSIRNLQIPSELISRLGCKQIIDITDKLPVNPKYTWSQLAGTRDVNDLTTIGLHHDDYPKANTAKYTDLQLATNMAYDHIALKKNEVDGDAGFPYHVWIRNGQAYQTNDILDRTYGIGSNNGYIVHVCVSGDYTKDALTDADKKAILGVMYALTLVLPAYKEIKGHCELNKTECPVYDFKGIKDEFKTLQMQMVRDDSLGAQRERAYAVKNQVDYMYGMVGKADGNEAWSLGWFSDFNDFLKSKSML